MLQSQGIIIFCWDQGCHLAVGAHPLVCHM